MGNQRFNLFSPIEKADGDTFWHKIGIAYENKNKNGFTLTFNSLPLPGKDGITKVMMFKDEPREGGWGSQQDKDQQKKDQEDSYDDLDDDIPF